MSMNQVYGADQVLVTAPSGGLAAGDAYLSGTMFGVAANAIAEGEQGYLDVVGTRRLAFATGTPAVANASAYWDPTAKKIYTAWATGRGRVGSFFQAAGSTDGVCYVRLAGIPVLVGDTDDDDIRAAEVSFDNGDADLPGDPADVQAAIDEIVSLFQGMSAAGVPYVNTESGLAADDVQAAIDEVVSDVEDKADEAYTNVGLPGVTTIAGALDAIVTRLIALEGA